MQNEQLSEPSKLEQILADMAVLSPTELARIAAALPDDTLAVEAARRGPGMRQAIGELALNQAFENLLMEYEERNSELRNNFSVFLDHNSSLNALDQIVFMDKFWSLLDWDGQKHRPPILSSQQLTTLDETLSKHPGLRVIPTPLLSLGQRLQAVESARPFIHTNLQSRMEIPLLAARGSGTVYGRLSANPERVINIPRGRKLAQRYKTLDDTVVDRRMFAASLVNSGHAILADDMTWIFPVVNLDVVQPREKMTAGELHRELHPLVVPELLLAMQLMYLINGAPNLYEATGITNEAVYYVDDAGMPLALAHVAEVWWDSNRLFITPFANTDRSRNPCIRDVISGI